MITVLDEGQRTACKQHTCSVCGGLILAGSEYWAQSCADGRQAWIWKAHGLCAEVSWALARELGLYDDEWISEDGMIDWLKGWFESLATVFP